MSKKELTLDDLRFPMVVKWDDMVYYIEEDGRKLHWCLMQREGTEWFLNNIGKDILGKDNLLGYLNKGLVEILASPPTTQGDKDYYTYPKTDIPISTLTVKVDSTLVDKLQSKVADMGTSVQVRDSFTCPLSIEVKGLDRVRSAAQELEEALASVQYNVGF